jgi:hypothetical protein
MTNRTTLSSKRVTKVIKKIRPLSVTVQQSVHVGFIISESANLKAILLIPSWIFKSIYTRIAEAY